MNLFAEVTWSDLGETYIYEQTLDACIPDLKSDGVKICVFVISKDATRSNLCQKCVKKRASGTKMY